MKYFVLLVMLAFISCAKDQPVRTPDNPSILQFIAKAPELSILHAAILRVPLDSAFSSGGPFTFFAPTDSAFNAAGLTLDKINQMDTATLRSIILYHIAYGRINGTELFGFFQETLNVLNPKYQPTVTKNYYGIFLNGAKVIKADIAAGDGVVQEVNQVALAPVGNVYETMASQPDLAYMTSFFDNMPSAKSMLVNSQVTLVAINDAAWKNYGYPTLESFQQADQNFLYQYFISYCIASGVHFTPEFIGGYYLRSSVPGNYVRFDIDGLHVLGQTPMLVKKDTRATNGVVDVMNGVFYSN